MDPFSFKLGCRYDGIVSYFLNANMCQETTSKIIAPLNYTFSTLGISSLFVVFIVNSDPFTGFDQWINIVGAKYGAENSNFSMAPGWSRLYYCRTFVSIHLSFVFVLVSMFILSSENYCEISFQY